MDDKKENNLNASCCSRKSSLVFKAVDDDDSIRVYGCENKRLGTIAYFEGCYAYVFRASKSAMVALTLADLLAIADKIKELSK